MHFERWEQNGSLMCQPDSFTLLVAPPTRCLLRASASGSNKSAFWASWWACIQSETPRRGSTHGGADSSVHLIRLAITTQHALEVGWTWEFGAQLAVDTTLMSALHYDATSW